MKTKPEVHEPLYLNLYNFDSTSAQDSPYILTSPRSLEACRKAGLKPVELLKKSLHDYEDDLEGLSTEKVFQLYTIQEQDRINNLEKCRAIRKSIALQKNASKILKENARPTKAESIDSYSGTSSRKAKLDKENSSRVNAVSPPTPLRFGAASKSAVLNNKLVQGDERTVEHRQGFLNLTAGAKGLAFEESSSNELSVAGGAKKIKRSGGKKSFGKDFVASFPSHPAFTLPLSASSNCSSSLSSVSTVRASNSTLTPTRPKDKPVFGARLCYQRPPKADRFSGYRKHSQSPSGSWQQRSVAADTLSQDTNNNCDSTSNKNSSTLSSSFTAGTNALHQRKKQVSFQYLKCADDSFLSEHDRRILESMALKKEMERENQEFAFQAHRLWEQDRETRQQLSKAQEQQWKEYVAEKRRLESERNLRKWEEMKTSLRQSQFMLEQSLLAKDERARKLKKKIEERKMIEMEDRSMLAARRRAEVEASNRQLELDTSLRQHSLDKQQKDKLERAESTRKKQREYYRKRVASANRVEELRHQDRWQLIREETENALQDLREFCRLRETKAQLKHEEILINRDLTIKEQSIERQLKYQQARRFQDELDQGLEKWQDQVLRLQWESSLRAECSVSRQLEAKRQRVEAENQAREKHHSKLMERICREDEARNKYVRQLIALKEEKMRRMARSRDAALNESRAQAQTTADLREHIRKTLSPDTFDRKVARVALEMRVASRPPTASPTMNRSHIFLG